MTGFHDVTAETHPAPPTTPSTGAGELSAPENNNNNNTSQMIGKQEAKLMGIVPRNNLRAVFQWAGYKEVELGAFPQMAAASDEEVRKLMESDFWYKQWNGHLFLRVRR